MKFFLCLIGLLLIVEGTPYFAFPGRMKKWMLMIQETSDNQLRAIGFISICIGFVLLYFFI